MIHFLQSQGFLLQKYLVHLWLESSLAPPFVGLKAFVVDLSFPSWHIPSALMATGRWNWRKRGLLSQSIYRNPVLKPTSFLFFLFFKTLMKRHYLHIFRTAIPIHLCDLSTTCIPYSLYDCTSFCGHFLHVCFDTYVTYAYDSPFYPCIRIHLDRLLNSNHGTTLQPWPSVLRRCVLDCATYTYRKLSHCSNSEDVFNQSLIQKTSNEPMVKEICSQISQQQNTQKPNHHDLWSARSAADFHIYLPHSIFAMPSLNGLSGSLWEGFGAASDPAMASTFWMAVATFCYTEAGVELKYFVFFSLDIYYVHTNTSSLYTKITYHVFVKTVFRY